MSRVIYVNIPNENPRNALSFEVSTQPLSHKLLDTISQVVRTQEHRMQDYLHAYRSTGKPPMPCPQHPTDRARRIALGLPPFMEPYSEIAPINMDILMAHCDGPSSVANGVSPGPIRDVQIFRPEPVTNEVRGAVFQCIVCQPEFLAWSVEVRVATSYPKHGPTTICDAELLGGIDATSFPFLATRSLGQQHTRKDANML